MGCCALLCPCCLQHTRHSVSVTASCSCQLFKEQAFSWMIVCSHHSITRKGSWRAKIQPVRWSLRDIWYGVGTKAYVSDVGKYKYCLLPVLIKLYENRNLSCEKPSQKQIEKENFLKCSHFRKEISEMHSKWTWTAIKAKQKLSQINTEKFFISGEVSEDLLIL